MNAQFRVFEAQLDPDAQLAVVLQACARLGPHHRDIVDSVLYYRVVGCPVVLLTERVLACTPRERAPPPPDDLRP